MSSGGFTAQTKELKVRATDYLDWTPGDTNAVLNYAFRQVQSFFTVGALSPKPISKIDRVTVYVLPRASNAAIASTSFMALYNTPALSSVNDETQTAGAQNTQRAVSQRSTLVNPTFNTKWVKVGYTNFNKTFNSSQLLPVRVDTADGTSAGINLFELAMLDVDSGESFKDAVQLRVDVEYTQTLSTTTNQEISTVYTNSFGATITPVFAQTYAQVELLSVADTV